MLPTDSSNSIGRRWWNSRLRLLTSAGYRDYLDKWVNGLGTLRAIASSGSIAAWALWREHAFVWAATIAVPQVADALRDVFPFTKRHKAASAHTIVLGSM